MTGKTCARCNKNKELTSFDKKPRGKLGRRATCRQCRDEARSDRVIPTPRFHRRLESKRYLITAAQNATPIHEAFFETLRTTAKELDAELVVIPLRYKNPTSQWTASQRNADVWAREVQPFLFNQRKKLNPNIAIVGDVKTQPTASSPLTGFESLTGPESCILGHTKMQLKTVPVPSGRGFPKLLTTTGACTVPNYTDSKAGKIGRFHHYLGALIVEVSGKKFHLRQLNADRSDGSFYDLDRYCTHRGITKAGPAEALILGDLHRQFLDKGVERATFGPGGMTEVLNQKRNVFHDTNDNYALNPYHLGNLFIAKAKAVAKMTDARKETQDAVEFVRQVSKGRYATIVASNHDDFLARWVVRMLREGCHDPTNVEFFLETALAMFASVKMTSGGTRYADPFQYWVKKLAPEIHAAALDESVMIAGNECGMHGHIGPSGARGSVKNLSRLGVKVVSGHGHGPEIQEGHYRVGKSTGRLEYEHGPDGTLQTHCVIYPNGKRALLNIIDGEYQLRE